MQYHKTIGIRPQTRDLAEQLSKMISNDLGTQISMASAIDIAIKEAITKRKPNDSKELENTSDKS
jgi:hypothetical protein